MNSGETSARAIQRQKELKECHADRGGAVREAAPPCVSPTVATREDINAVLRL